MKNKADGKHLSEEAKLNAIKDIIFGDSIQQFNEQLKMMQKQIDEMRNEFNQKIEVMNAELMENMNTINTSVKKLDKAQKNMVVTTEKIEEKVIEDNRALLSKLFISMGESIKK